MMSNDETTENNHQDEEEEEEMMTATNQTETELGNKLRKTETFMLPWNTE